MEWMQLVVSILTGLAACIPLAVKLIQTVQKMVKEKNWAKMVNMVIELMQTAESKLENGADKKEWVLAMVKSSADTINYDINIEEVGALIDSLCDMSKVVNGKTVAPVGKKDVK